MVLDAENKSDGTELQILGHTMNHDAGIRKTVTFSLFTCMMLNYEPRTLSLRNEPAASSKEPIEHACPTQYVCIGDDTYWQSTK